MTALKMLLLIGYCLVAPWWGVGRTVSNFLTKVGV